MPQINTSLILPSIVVGLLVVVGFMVVIVLGQKMSRTFKEPEEQTRAISATYGEKPLSQYYVKASANSCASGDYKNDFVSLAALNNVISNGCRFLDFEIYDLAGEPVVGISEIKDFHFKGSYNSIPLFEVFKTIKNRAFNISNGRDPLFLQFRIKCEHKEVCNKISSYLQSYFGEKLLENNYSYGKENIAAIPLKAFMSKVTVIVDMTNKVVENSSLAEFVNLGAGTAYNTVYSSSDLIYNPNQNIIEYSKSYIVTSLPEISNDPHNYDATAAFNQGVQFIAMKFQRKDKNLELYINEFDSYAFKLKPTNLQYVPNKVRPPKKSGATLSPQEIMDMLKAGANTLVTNVKE
jgi:hypothetical protein